ncbi:DUF1365 domain-containing protein [Veronia pacifica]|uniref:Chromosome partitioning protein ParA n=1 Tax=Veronia pacifica TaxID=1080227 RepID=A0A1C3EMW2_9GAMM|nr:DUF1365 family protein [Veronia pacifica]ODA34574.1 chromosome partitioning protein ParA [Veronia pacifica]
MTVSLSSGLYTGIVRHRRFTPVNHCFKYDIFMPVIDLDELEILEKQVAGFKLGKWGVAAFHATDYLDGRADTKLACQDKLFELTGDRLTGKVMALCHLRYFGMYFSPVNFYYLYDDKGNWRYMLAEVSNTPWNQRHYYAVPAGNKWENDKEFHVSPFNPLEQLYKWRLRPLSDKAFVHLETHRDNREFDATLALEKQAFTSGELAKILLKTPLITVKVLVLIYWQAAKLWFKGARFYSHPDQAKE